MSESLALIYLAGLLFLIGYMTCMVKAIANPKDLAELKDLMQEHGVVCVSLSFAIIAVFWPVSLAVSGFKKLRARMRASHRIENPAR